MRFHSRRYFGLLLGVVGVLVLGIGSFSYAQARNSPTPTPLKVPDAAPATGLNLTLSPTYISLTTDPGKEVTSQFKITNNNTFTEYLQVAVAKMEVGADGRPVLRDMEATDAFGKWLSLPEDTFQIGGNQSK